MLYQMQQKYQCIIEIMLKPIWKSWGEIKIEGKYSISNENLWGLPDTVCGNAFSEYQCQFIVITIVSSTDT